MVLTNTEKKMNKKLILCRALPGAGKTTLANKLKDENTVLCSADDFFEFDTGYHIDFNLLSIAHKYCIGNTFY